jgi:hypothetical protein
MSKINGYDFGDAIILYSTLGSSTSNTTITSLGNILIPANTYNGTYDVLRVDAYYTKLGTNGGYDVRLYWNTTPDLNGSPIFFGLLSGTSTSVSTYTFRRRLVITGSTNPTTYATTNTTSITQDLSSSPTLDFTGYNMNWSVDSYIVAAGRVISNLDSVQLGFLKISNG